MAQTETLEFIEKRYKDQVDYISTLHLDERDEVLESASICTTMWKQKLVAKQHEKLNAILPEKLKIVMEHIENKSISDEVKIILRENVFTALHLLSECNMTVQ